VSIFNQPIPPDQQQAKSIVFDWIYLYIFIYLTYTTDKVRES